MAQSLSVFYTCYTIYIHINCFGAISFNLQYIHIKKSRSRVAHCRSFVLSDLSELLTVAHLIWVKWANERMSKFPALYIRYSRYRYRYRYRYIYINMYMYIYIPNLLYIHSCIRGNLSNKTICVKMMILALVAARTKKYVAFLKL